MVKKGFIVVLMVFSLAVAGCSGQTGEPGGDQGLQGSITLAGSTSVAPVAEVLAEEFMNLNNNVQIHVQSSGSSAGIKAAEEDSAEIGMSSRELKPEEKGINEVVIAKDGIVMVVNNANTSVSNLSIEQVRKIYAGEINKWSTVGGQDSPITVVTRETGSGTRGAFEDIVMDGDEIYSGAIVQGSTGAVKTAVQNDPNAIGFISLAALDSDVKDLSVEGVKGTVENIQNGSYKIARPFLFLTNLEPEGVVKAFIDYVLSSEGQDLAVEEGLIPIN